MVAGPVSQFFGRWDRFAAQNPIADFGMSALVDNAPFSCIKGCFIHAFRQHRVGIDMSRILEAIEQVKQKEGEAARLVSTARDEADTAVRAAEKSGGELFEAKVKAAEEEAGRRLAAGREGARNLRRRIENEGRESLTDVNRLAALNLKAAVDFLVERFMKIHGPGAK